MDSLKQARFALETLLVRLGLVLLPRLPRRAAAAAARAAGRAAYLLASGQRRVTLANLALAFGDRLPPAARRRLAREAFETMARVLVDLFWFARDTEARVRRYVTLDPGTLARIGPHAIIGVTAHFGNWELLSKAFGVYGFPHVAAASPLQNPAVDALIGAGRATAGVEIVSRRGAARGLLRALRQGRHIALLLDQNTKPAEGGLFVEFFGRPAATSTAAAVLSARTGAPILPLFCRADPGGMYTIHVRDRLPPPAHSGPAAIRASTQAIAAAFEAEIRAAPGQWLWMYKRWKYVDPERPDAGYPPYAKPLAAPARGP